MHAIRLAVRENVLQTVEVTEESYVAAIEETGRGFVAVEDDAIRGFAVANRLTGNIWALFVHPEHEGRGYGRELQHAMLSWLFTTGVARAWLTTAANTRAERFYRASGWRFVEHLKNGEVLFERSASERSDHSGPPVSGPHAGGQRS